MKIINVILFLLLIISCEQKKDYQTTNNGIRYKIQKEGIGDAANLYDEVTVSYKGWVVRDSTDLFEDWSLIRSKTVDEFENTYRTKDSLIFNIGVGAVLKGFDLGVIGMKKGEQRTFVVPPKLAYGEESVGMTIPAFATLKFFVEVREINAGKEPRVENIENGYGEVISDNDRVQYRYELWALEPEEKKLSASIDNGFADVTHISSLESPLFHSKYLRGMRVGGKRNVYYKNAGNMEKVNFHILQKLEKIKPWNISELEEEETSSGLKYYIHDRGAGRQIKSGYQVRLHCSGYLEENLSLFKSSLENGKPITVSIDSKEIIKGWNEALKLVRVGTRLTLIVPPELAYGDKQAGYIPPNSELRYDIHVIYADTKPKNLSAKEEK